MEISAKEQRILLIQSGNRCAFPDCPEPLVHHVGPAKRPVVTAQMAHIVSASSDGPRGQDYLPEGEHDKHANLIAFCPKHHKVVDDQPQVFTTERLRQIKADHEAAIEKAIAHSYTSETSHVAVSSVTEQVHSTLLPVLLMPRFIWSAPCVYNDRQEKEAAKQLSYPPGSSIICPFLIREGGCLYAFNNLGQEHGPFDKIVRPKEARRFQVQNWLSDTDKSAWFASILNRSLNKLTGRKGLRLDKEHRRYYFESKEVGKVLEVKYRPLNQRALVSRNAVWQPISKRTGEPRPFWYHLAARLGFLRAGANEWALTIRPELRVTKDGVTPIESERVGSQTTRRKSKMYNYDLLEELNFWRDFLSDGRPRIKFDFGDRQAIVVSTTLISSQVVWPGMPEEFAKPFRNIAYDEDLFSLADLAAYETSAQNGDDEVEGLDGDENLGGSDDA